MLVATFTGALGLNAVDTMNRLDATHDLQYGEVYTTTGLLAAWLNAARVSESDLAEYVLETDPGTRAEVRAEIESADLQLAELGAQLDGFDNNRADVDDLAALSQAWRAYAGVA